MAKKSQKNKTTSHKTEEESLSVKKQDQGQKNTLYVLLITLLIVGVGYFYTRSDGSSEISTVSPAKTLPSGVEATPHPILKGKEVYSVSQGKGIVGAKVRSVEIDPHDPAKGVSQRIALTTDAEAEAASVIVRTDNGEKEMVLEKESGDEDTSVWSVSWEVNDEVLWDYSMTFSTVNASNQINELNLMIRDLAGELRQQEANE